MRLWDFMGTNNMQMFLVIEIAKRSPPSRFHGYREPVLKPKFSTVEESTRTECSVPEKL